jgi:ubiquinone/menaquinone biosynthesis C-methylase UbiE
MNRDFTTRSLKLERIDTGDCTPAEYDRFLREIRLVNRFAGDNRALKNSLIKTIREENLTTFSVLDVGAGSGELLRVIAKFARKGQRKAALYGLELNERSAVSITEESRDYDEIKAVRGDALRLPFRDDSFDFAISSLFTHHFTDENIVAILRELDRVARRGIFVIDLHRHKNAYFLYQLFCKAFRISPLVREDGSLSILRSFVPAELYQLAEVAGLKKVAVEQHFPYRLVLRAG